MLRLRRRIRSTVSGSSSVAPGTVLLTWSDGIFDRAQTGIASYLTSATTLAYASEDQLRMEDRGDGFGAIALFEARKNNYGDLSEDVSGWIINGSATVTANFSTAPDGNATADRLNYAANINSAMRRNCTTIPTGANFPLTMSWWARNNSSAVQNHMGFINRDAVFQIIDQAPQQATWTRYDVTGLTGATTTGVVVRDYQTTAATAHTCEYWGSQVEDGYYPTSYIQNTAGGTSPFRTEDSLYFLAAQIPALIRSGRWQQKVYPLFANTDLQASQERWLYSFGDGNAGIRFRKTGGNVLLEAVNSGSVVAASGALTFARHAELTCIVDLPRGQLTVNAAAGSAGSAIVFPGGVEARIGGIVGGNNEADCRMAYPTAA